MNRSNPHECDAGVRDENFDVAMNSSNATVYTYYKCSEYKGATCQFKAV
jgi:hypothetical protein